MVYLGGAVLAGIMKVHASISLLLSTLKDRDYFPTAV
jgi:hypothetical protein